METSNGGAFKFSEFDKVLMANSDKIQSFSWIAFEAPRITKTGVQSC